MSEIAIRSTPIEELLAQVKLDMALKRPCRACGGSGTEWDPAKLGPKLAAQRLEAGVTAAALARALKMSTTLLCDREKGRKGWTEVSRAKYERALGKLARAAKEEL